MPTFYTSATTPVSSIEYLHIHNAYVIKFQIQDLRIARMYLQYGCILSKNDDMSKVYRLHYELKPKVY